MNKDEKWMPKKDNSYNWYALGIWDEWDLLFYSIIWEISNSTLGSSG